MLATPTWLTHTWKYISETGFTVYSDISPLSILCKQDEFIMEKFWEMEVWGNELARPNCRMWMQNITISEIMDGTGSLSYLDS